MTNNRNYKIDVLRSIAIILIILAHVNPPSIIFQLRTFDVPLITMLTAMSFVITYKPDQGFGSYFLKRFKRLIIPAWIFLTIFFIIFTLINITSHSDNIFNLKILLESYSLLSGIGYVWIIRIFFIIAIFSPFLLKIVTHTSNFTNKIVLIIILFIIQKGLVLFSTDLTGLKYVIFNLIIANSFGYLIVSLVGMYVFTQSEKHNYYFLLFFTIIFSIGLSSLEPVNSFKYPPSPYYLSYGILVSIFLWILLSKKTIEQKLNKQIFVWLSKNSLNLYYWHILPVYYLTNYTTNINWLFQFGFVFLFTILITLLQNKYFPNIFTIK
ncbi:acyltransferase family protein [Vagococcus fluvialis]|uniref:acyltransferase family protein n=1 Tax=Vagococcus fluvialis TaxID=2738 RepID=UPI003B211469